jgi:hypothetical protein
MIVTKHIRGRQTSEAQAEVLPSLSRSCSLISPDFILFYFIAKRQCVTSLRLTSVMTSR